MLASLSWWVIGCAPIDVDLGVQNHYIHPRHRKSTVSHYSLKIYVIQYPSITRYRGAFPQFRDERADRGEPLSPGQHLGAWGQLPEVKFPRRRPIGVRRGSTSTIPPTPCFLAVRVAAD